MFNHLAVPSHRLRLVLLDPPTDSVPLAEIELRVGKPLFGGLAEPGDRLRVVLLHPAPVGIHPTEVFLRVGAPLLGGLAVPRDGWALAGVHHAEIVLRWWIPLLRRFTVPGDRLRVVLLHPAPVLVQKTEAGHSRQATCRRRLPALRQRFLIAFRFQQGATKISFQIGVVGMLFNGPLASGHGDGRIDLLERDAGLAAPPERGQLPALLGAGADPLAGRIRRQDRIFRQQQQRTRQGGHPTMEPGQKVIGHNRRFSKLRGGRWRTTMTSVLNYSPARGGLAQREPPKP